MLSCSNGSLYVVEHTVGYETNLENNVKRKKAKYRELVKQLNQDFHQVKFVNLSMLANVGLDTKHQTYCIRRIMNIAIRSTYYIFCCQNKEWESPDLLTI